MSLEVLQRNLRLLAQQTELTAQRERLRETEQFFRSVLELAPDGLMVVDPNGVIRLASARCEPLFGYTRDELIGQPVEMLVPRDVSPTHAALREQFHRSPTAREMGAGRELRGRRKDGSEFPIEIGLSPLPARGSEGAQVAVSIRDVTERKEQEKALKLAKVKAEEATETKSMFLANMSHEIRTPMNAILNMTGLALEADLPAKPHQFITVAHSSARNLLGILNDILDFSKIEADKLELENAPFSLREVLEEVTETFRSVVVQKHVELITHAVPTVPDRLRGDALRVRQVLTNLVSNAFKFTEKGEVLLKAETVDRTGDASGPGEVLLRISVRDTGIGISADQQARLFQSFSSGGQLNHAEVRRHRTWPRDQPASGPSHGRRPDGRKHAGQGHHFLLYRAPRRRGPVRDAGSRRSGWNRRAAGAHRRRHRDEPRAPGDAAARLVDSDDVGCHGRRGTHSAGESATGKEARIRSASSSSTGCCPA